MLYFGTRARLFKISRFQDSAVKRMLSKLQNIEKAALPQDELREVMDGAPTSPGICSPPQGWMGWPGGKPEHLGRREVVRKNQSFLWGRREAEAGRKMPQTGQALPAGGASTGGGPKGTGRP